MFPVEGRLIGSFELDLTAELAGVPYPVNSGTVTPAPIDPGGQRDQRRRERGAGLRQRPAGPPVGAEGRPVLQ